MTKNLESHKLRRPYDKPALRKSAVLLQSVTAQTSSPAIER
nr:hypothetical protein [Mesorhizobium sp.]